MNENPIISIIYICLPLTNPSEMEMLRRRSEKNIRSYSAREKMQEADEQAKVRTYDNRISISKIFLLISRSPSNYHKFFSIR